MLCLILRAKAEHHDYYTDIHEHNSSLHKSLCFTLGAIHPDGSGLYSTYRASGEGARAITACTQMSAGLEHRIAVPLKADDTGPCPFLRTLFWDLITIAICCSLRLPVRCSTLISFLPPLPVHQAH